MKNIKKIDKEELKNKIKTHFKENQKQIIINFISFFLLFAFLLFIDLIIKQIFYVDGENINYGDKRVTDWKIIAFGSFLHKGTTLFGQKLPNSVLHFFSFVVFIVSIIACLLIKTKRTFVIVFALAIICAGTFGNMIDRMIYLGVRDVIFIPWGRNWLPGGIFNFADVTIAIGAIFTIIYILVITIINLYNDKNKEKTTTQQINTENINYNQENNEL
ncbi:signal peptidase II [Mycoplasma miroungirhinis]|uniref:Signal peptidase II n=1 Tax=Mycoplasma miroungirhinis TaxID=754516 RepID=A0A6M4JAX2_9MOLU|nr:signal peptidase II [Mycoplasma miroungirhinis]QJR44123.1 signal peptidase II [Mycoplasma miroungirhinis]